MVKTTEIDVPRTLEGWYTLHDVYAVDWRAMRCLETGQREAVAGEAVAWLREESGCERGDSAVYSVLSQKGDLMFVHYRETPEDINAVELSLRGTRLFDFLVPAYSYLSMIEVSLNEVTAIVMKRLAEQGIERGDPGFDEAYEAALARQKDKMTGRLYRDVPAQRYISFYPMNKKRGEQVNWYSLSADERRQMMRRHGSIGHKYADTVTQVIGGSVGLDDWEWGVSLH
ncbi:MAG: chlorite dismutase family protein, partial [Candidatus Binatia bacterium]